MIRRIWRKQAVMAVVLRGRGAPRPDDVAGVIIKVHVACYLAGSIRVYPS